MRSVPGVRVCQASVTARGDLLLQGRHVRFVHAAKRGGAAVAARDGTRVRVRAADEDVAAGDSRCFPQSARRALTTLSSRIETRSQVTSAITVVPVVDDHSTGKEIVVHGAGRAARGNSRPCACPRAVKCCAVPRQSRVPSVLSFFAGTLLNRSPMMRIRSAASSAASRGKSATCTPAAWSALNFGICRAHAAGDNCAGVAHALLRVAPCVRR